MRRELLQRGIVVRDVAVDAGDTLLRKKLVHLHAEQPARLGAENNILGEFILGV